MENKQLDKAISFALLAHAGQKRKSGGPYIIHPLEVMTIAATMTFDDAVLCAAVLHDTVEDTAVTMEQIEQTFGEKVSKLVNSETESKRREIPPEQSWKIRKQEALDKLAATTDRNIKIIWLSDKLANMRSLYQEKQKAADAVWQRFHQKDPRQHYWYYHSALILLESLSDTPAWQELDMLIKKVFVGMESEEKQ
jgi:(p)ppGpp synthase/HD superfamily hydrolase